MENLIPVNMVVGDRNYRIRIDPVNEEIVRKTVKLINDKILEFKSLFAGKDMQDYIAMVVLWYATNEKEAGRSQPLSTDFTGRIKVLEEMLDQVLEKK